MEVKEREWAAQAAQKEEEAEARVQEGERQLREALVLSEKRTEENFTLKQRIDAQRQELDKLRKRAETLQDQVVQRESEVKQAKEDCERLQKRQRML